jgi:tetratricopeptide (TPR) repeat protein
MIGLWHGLRLGWVIAAFALMCGARDKRWAAIAAIIGSLGLNVCIADDISRSSSVIVPAVLAGIIYLARRPALRPRLALPLLAFGNLLLPAAHIIATPLSQTERYHTTPVRSLPAEREQARHPPEFADPAVYTERGMQAFAAGENEIARGQFELALRFDPEFARARAHRGILLFVGGETKQGLAEIDRALTRDPAMFDVRLQRATFRQQLGDLRGAAADAEEAVRAMPADWPRRREAERFAQALGAQASAGR